MLLCLMPCFDDVSSEDGIINPGQMMRDRDNGQAYVDYGLSYLIRPPSSHLSEATHRGRRQTA